MKDNPPNFADAVFSRAKKICAVAAVAWASVLLATAAAGAQSADSPVTTTLPGTVGATLEQCVTSDAQVERSVTFTAEMTAVAGAAKMAMRIDLQERQPGDAEFHTVSAAGLGVWRAADPKVKVYKYFRQVTNLSAPASYRGIVRFHWMSAKGHVIKRAERVTTRCFQPSPPTEQTTPAPAPPQATSPSVLDTTPVTSGG